VAIMDVPQLVEGLIRIHGSPSKAARACEMPEGTLYKLRVGERKHPRSDTLELLARGYGKSLSEMFAMNEGAEDDTHANGDKAGA